METTINTKIAQPGETGDDAQYLAMKSGKDVNAGGVSLFSVTLEGGRTVRGILRGEPSITNTEGEKIDTAEKYYRYISKEHGTEELHFDKMACIELMEGETRLGVVRSMEEGLHKLKNLS